jgi:fatty-acyl-CoA synthase
VASERLDLVLHDRDCAAAAAGCEVASCLDDRVGGSSRDARRSVRPPSRHGRLIILTSGTTGRPKGATHRADGSAQGVAALVGPIPFRPRDTQVVAAPLFHGWGLTNLLLGLARSSTTVLTRAFDAAQTLDAVSRQRADVLVLVPVMLQRILALGPQALVEADTSRLRVIASSGSALGGKLVGETLDRLGPVLYNVYGSTEVTVATIATPSDLRRNPGCAGRPVLGARVEILDDQGKPAVPPSIGRVFVGTATRFEGYTNGGGKEERRGLLSTGDLGHFDPSGLLVIDGREDDMIVSGGENVYPAEVEDLLAHHPGIAQVAVVGIPDREFGQGLAAFVIAGEGHDLTVEDVKRHVRNNLARFKVPRRVEFLAELPRTSTGKVLKRELVETCLDRLDPAGV